MKLVYGNIKWINEVFYLSGNKIPWRGIRDIYYCTVYKWFMYYQDVLNMKQIRSSVTTFITDMHIMSRL